MRTQQFLYKDGGWSPPLPKQTADTSQLVLCFGCLHKLQEESLLHQVRQAFPEASVAGCSTAGEILDSRVYDDSFTATAIQFEKTGIRAASADLTDFANVFEVGKSLSQRLNASDLQHILVFSEGLSVNGSLLVDGMTSELPAAIKITGGLAGDYSDFQHSEVWLDEHRQQPQIVAIGFYGENLHIGYGSLGGWDPFGPEREITCSEGNVLYELDGQSALDLYKQYLGDYASGLPSTGLLFPLAVKNADAPAVVRTILATDDANSSITFAGDMPEGATASFMKANFERLIEGASLAAQQTVKMGRMPVDFGLLISCVGRKMILTQRVEEEVESVREVLGTKAALTGFYSYGEICPVINAVGCSLHNQTMTITTFTEV